MRDVAEAVSKVGFKMFLNIVPTVTFGQGGSTAAGQNAEGNPGTPQASAPPPASDAAAPGSKEFSLILTENPLAEFVELPPEVLRGGLWYSNVLSGVLRGALEMVRLDSYPRSKSRRR